MNKMLLSLWLGLSSLYIFAQTNIPESSFIKVDQFGYLPNAVKVAVISNPQTGYNAGDAFTAATTYQLRNWQNDAVIFSASPQVWNGGATHTQSGDKGWWFNFSSVTTPGNYYIYDVSNNVRSYQFEINDDVYSPVLKAAMRMFFYNRCNFAKQAPYAEPGFSDGVAFSNNLQDANCRYVFDKNNAATEKDLSGGWYDAGDFNKYVTFADRVMHDLLSAYEENAAVFTDNFNIPESGNGIPDILDELKWELDWLLKMNNSDGSTHIKIGSQNYSDNTLTPPSNNTDPRYYGPTCSSASISVAGVFAHAALVMQQIPALSSYAQILRSRAITSWNYVLPSLNNNTLDTTCDNGEIISGDADWDATTQQKKALKAAIYLFALTGNNTYNQFITNNASSIAANQITNAYWDVYEMPLNDALLFYSSLPNANSSLASSIINSFTNAAAGNSSSYFGFSNTDLYRAFMPDNAYHWGSNLTKAGYGVLNTALVNYDINSSSQSSYQLKAAEQLHYFHGVNPLNLVYLTNMSCYGAENSATEIYHQWFSDGSDWDNSLTSLYGPAPGYVPGGPNKDFSLSSPSPPANQPPQKSYANFNSGFPTNSWEITEPAIYYQSIYVRLLANYAGQQIACPAAGAACDDGNPNTINDEENGFCCCEGIVDSGGNCTQITDGTFDVDLSNWYWWNCTPVISNGECQVNSIVAGANPWDAAIAQSGLIFEQGKQYEISFDARASAARTVTVKAGLSVAPFTIYNYVDVNIATTTQPYVINFTMLEATSFSGSLEFYIGSDPSAIVLDNIALVELPCVSTCSPILTLNGVVSNSLYEAGSNITSTSEVISNGDVHFHAGKRISLENSFSVPANATFRAAIEPCGTATD